MIKVEEIKIDPFNIGIHFCQGVWVWFDDFIDIRKGLWKSVDSHSLYYSNPNMSFGSCIKSTNDKQNEYESASQYWRGLIKLLYSYFGSITHFSYCKKENHMYSSLFELYRAYVFIYLPYFSLCVCMCVCVPMKYEFFAPSPLLFISFPYPQPAVFHPVCAVSTLLVCVNVHWITQD